MNALYEATRAVILYLLRCFVLTNLQTNVIYCCLYVIKILMQDSGIFGILIKFSMNCKREAFYVVIFFVLPDIPIF